MSNVPFEPEPHIDLRESLVADWTQMWTVEEAERELPGYTHNGPGWYPNGRGIMLVQESFDRNLFRFSVWNSLDARHLMLRLLALPIRS